MTSSRYRLCGVTLGTDWPLQTRLVPSGDTPDLRFGVSEAPPHRGDWEPSSVLADNDRYALPGKVGSREVIRFDGTGDAWFLAEDEIVFHLTRPEHDYQVEVLLLGLILSYWLERRGLTALHASAVSVGGRGIGILGPNGSGKTSLALEMMDMGHRFMTDDLLAVSPGHYVTAHPAFPQARLWPHEAEARFGSTAGLPRAHPSYEKLRIPVPGDRFSTESAPLVALYVRGQHDSSGNDFEPVEGPPALFHLMFNCFARALVDTPANRHHWMARLGRVLETTPVFSAPSQPRGPVSQLAGRIADHAMSLAQSKRPV